MKINKETHIYKETTDCLIKADVYFNDVREAPVIIYIHGGALIWGSRENINPRQIEIYRKAGFSIVSIDYRLAPETPLNLIVEDVRDALLWVCS